MIQKAIVLLSGEVDSATALYSSLKQGYNVQALTYNYRSRVPREQEAAREIASHAKVKLIEVELPFLQNAADIAKENPSAFQGVNVPEGYVPARNLVFYALATYHAEIQAAEYIIGGHLVTDSQGFPDAIPGFFHSLEQLINSTRLARESDKNIGIHLLMPFLGKTKTDIVKMAVELGVPLELTWSCYYNRSEQCGECVTCLEREEAFTKAGVEDPRKHYKSRSHD